MKRLKLHGDELIIGNGSLKYLESIVGKKVFIITGKSSVYKNGVMNKITDIIDKGENIIEVLSDIDANPDTEIVNEGVNQMKSFKPDIIIAVGGGSPIDAAKVMTLFYEYDYLDFNTLDVAALPDKRYKTRFIAVPTTSGTGTEVTKAAVITFKEKDIKIGLKTDAFIPDIAIMDPLVTKSMPKSVIAESGIDAMTHAMEAYMNNNLDDITEIMVIGAIEGLLEYLPLSYESDNLHYREKVHNYQCVAGMAFNNVGLGMSHGISHGFGGLYGYGHGLLNGVALPYVMDYNRSSTLVEAKLEKLTRKIGKGDIVDLIRQLNKKINIPNSFNEMGLEEKVFIEDFEKLIQLSLKGSTVRNPIEMNKESMEVLLKDIYYGRSK
jgi:alcohol dehydrogenase class IV